MCTRPTRTASALLVAVICHYNVDSLALAIRRWLPEVDTKHRLNCDRVWASAGLQFYPFL